MAEQKTSKSRAWFFPTSPRSPYKLQGELRLLKQLDGMVWDKSSQLLFAELLKAYPDFDGSISKDDPTFSARDRATRTPRLLGFVHFPKKGIRGGKLHFTDVGNAFIQASEDEQILIFQRQLAKVQFKSPLHCSGGFEDMSVRPLMIMIKLLLELNTMSKEEVALFGVTLTDKNDFDSRLSVVKKYRADIAKQANAGEKKKFRRNFAMSWMAEIYSEDIDNGRTYLREGGDRFLATKYQTVRDYADSTIRYLRATGLFTVSPHGQRLMLLKANILDAKFLLDNYGISLSSYSDLAYDAYVATYLGNSSLPAIRKDDAQKQAQDLVRMVGLLGVSKQQEQIYKDEYSSAVSSLDKLTLILRLERLLSSVQVKNEAMEIRSDFQQSLTNITETFGDIANKKTEILDRPLMYEWNTWRAMVLINDAKNVQGNYVADSDGNPTSTAGGKQPDIIVEYSTFWLAVEVTLQAGLKQYEAEGESVSRHVGTIQRQRIAENDKRPVFGLFVAEKIHDEVTSYLITQARYSSQVYKGPIRIIPMNRTIFEGFMKSALQYPNFSHRVLRSFFENCFTKLALDMGEHDWLSYIEAQVDQFSKLEKFAA